LETLGTLENKERGVGLEGQVLANMSPSHQEISEYFPCPHANPPSKAQRSVDIPDTHRCARGGQGDHEDQKDPMEGKEKEAIVKPR